MNKLFNYPNRLTEIYGTFIALGLIVFVFLLRLLGLFYIIELRLISVLIFIAAIYFAIKQYKRTHEEGLKYFKAIRIGIGSTFIGVSTFALFLFIYMELNSNFLEFLQRSEMLGEELNPYIASFAVWVQGIFAGLFATFLVVHSMRTKPV